ncbi:MAG: PAS domain-containing sensor histidine kinase [Proteobacteria bacterium]|nr:MAG: PAS domain-containing sensor histidine kinase [Pseudomonadota bacterium]
MCDPKYLFKAQNTAIVVLGGDRRTRLLNPAAEAVLDISDRRARGQPVAKVVGDYPPLHEVLDKAVDDGQTYTLREMPLRVPLGGEPAMADCTVTPLVEVGDPVGLMLELWRVDSLVKLARDSWLSARQSATRSMIRGLAHEIKNPLGGLRGAAQLLDRELPHGELREYTRIITHEADRLTKLVDRMSAPYLQIRREPLNLHEVLQHVYRLVQAEVQGRITIYRDYDPSLPDLVGERDGLVQVFLNIVRNAAQAIDGKGRITIRTRIDRRQSVGGILYRQVIRVQIHDDGPGVPEDLLEKMFYPLVTGRAEGTGLGLSLAQEIVSRHKGRIDCKSAPGDTTFTVVLPLEHGDE